MFGDNKLCKMLNIKYPIIQAGMVWVSGGKLAGAASKAGILGVIGAGSMKLDVLEEQIKKAQKIDSTALAVNIPLLYKLSKEQIDLAYELGIRIFITSAGSPKLYTKYLKDKNCIVIHVTSSAKLAKKCEDAGVDAVIVEGFEAGGHNGRDELTSLVLVPQCVDTVSIPVICAGGFYDARTFLAGLTLGASAVQMGTRFLLSQESRAHEKYKSLLLNEPETSTELVMKSTVPVRLFKNKFYQEIKELENTCAPTEKLIEHLGKGRAKEGMHLGDLDNGELEIGQVYSSISDIPSVEAIVQNIVNQALSLYQDLNPTPNESHT